MTLALDTSPAPGRLLLLVSSCATRHQGTWDCPLLVLSLMAWSNRFCVIVSPNLSYFKCLVLSTLVRLRLTRIFKGSMNFAAVLGQSLRQPDLNIDGQTPWFMIFMTYIKRNQIFCSWVCLRLIILFFFYWIHHHLGMDSAHPAVAHRRCRAPSLWVVPDTVLPKRIRWSALAQTKQVRSSNYAWWCFCLWIVSGFWMV